MKDANNAGMYGLGMDDCRACASTASIIMSLVLSLDMDLAHKYHRPSPNQTVSPDSISESR